MKKIKILFIFILYIFIFNETCASNVDNIKVIDNKNVQFTLSKDVSLTEGNINSEIKFLKDVEILFTSPDSLDQNKIVLNLAKDLEKNKTYSLLTILGPEANIDFVIGDSLEGFEISNSKNVNSGAQGLNRILVKDSKKLELYFNSVITETELEYKLLDEQKTEEITSTGNNIFNIKLSGKLDKLSNYLVMILSLKDKLGKEILIDEDLLEVKTEENLKDAEMKEGEPEIDLKAGATIDEGKDLKEADGAVTGTGNLESEALKAPETPDTGAETNILILFTFIINTFIFFRKKILK